MQQTADADVDVTEVAADAIIPVCGLFSSYSSAAEAAMAPVFSVTAATTAAAVMTTTPAAGSGLSC